MARHIEGPWYRASKNTWYATLNSKKVSLKVKGEENEAAATKAWHRLMAQEARDNQPPPTPAPKATPVPESNQAPKSEVTVKQLVDGFLQDADGRVSREAWRGYAKFLTPFSQAHGKRPAESITVHEAEGFARKPEWSSTYQAGFLGTLVMAYRWAVRQTLIASSPVKGVRKPPKASRGTKAVITEAEHKKLLSVADDVFGSFLVVLWHTGARPGEVTSLTAEQVNAATDGVIPLANHKTAHKGKARFLILTGEALAVVKERAEAVGNWLLFCGQYGALTPKAVSAKMERLCTKAGIRRVMAYGYRHTFATTALARGIPDATVAALLGHSGTAMLHKHYSHLTSQAQAMKEALVKMRA